MSVTQPFVGGWVTARQGDQGIRVTGLLNGELLRVEGDIDAEITSEGTYLFPIRAGTRFRCVKFVADDACPGPTTVEILNG